MERTAPLRPRIRLLIVDDSAVIRRILRETFEREPDFEVDIARDGNDALTRAASFKPDVVTLDVAMPGMDGLAVLRALPSRHACAVIMVSSLTAEGARVTLEALSLGAVDFVAKPSAVAGMDISSMRAQLVTKVRIAARTRRLAPSPAPAAPPPLQLRRPGPPPGPAAAPAAAPRTAPPPPPMPFRMPPGGEPGVVLIGVSTGGPRALERILPLLPQNFPWPVVITQHMPAAFTGVLAQRLDSRCNVTVVEAAEPTPLRPSTVVIAAGDRDLVLARDGQRLVAKPVPVDTTPWHPSTDRMVQSALEVVPAQRLIGVLLTGMGNDGAVAMAALHRQGGRTIAESEASCVVFGMPADLIRRNGATAILPVEKVAATLTEWVAQPVRAAAMSPRPAPRTTV